MKINLKSDFHIFQKGEICLKMKKQNIIDLVQNIKGFGQNIKGFSQNMKGFGQNNRDVS